MCMAKISSTYQVILINVVSPTVYLIKILRGTAPNCVCRMN